MPTDIENFYQHTPDGPWRRDGDSHTYRLVDCAGCGKPCMVTGRARFCSLACAKAKDRHPCWTGDNATYRAQHKRLDRERGFASEHPCSFEGECAGRMTWCFSEVGTRNCLDDYFPACQLHHYRYESAVQMMQKEPRPGTDGRWRPWRYQKRKKPSRPKRTPEPCEQIAADEAARIADLERYLGAPVDVDKAEEVFAMLDRSA